MDSIHEQAGNSAQAAAERIEEAATDIAEMARTATERLEEWGRDGFSSARDAVREQPILWSAISLGLVAALGVAATWLSARERARSSARGRRTRSTNAALRNRGGRARATRSGKRTNSARSENAAATD
jgi:hypothetical protein